MNKAYDKVVWVNAPSTSSPLNQTNLNKMSDALDTVDDRVVAMDTTVSGKADTTYVNTELAKKVDKVTGKGLSTVSEMAIGGNTQVGQAIGAITILQNDGNMEHYSLCNGIEMDDEMSPTSPNPVQNKVITATLENKADKDGNYEDMAVGQLLSNTFEEDKVPYNFRTSGGTLEIGDREYDTLVGGTVAFNQLVKNGNFAILDNWTNLASVSNNVGTSLSRNRYQGLLQSAEKIVVGHKYFMTVTATADSDRDLYLSFYQDSTAVVGSMFNVLANTFKKHEIIVNVPQTVNKFAISNWSSGNTIIQVKNFMCIDLTQMFGSTIADYIYSLEQATAGSGVAYFRSLFPKDYYDYNAGQLMSVKALSHKMIGFNQFDKSTSSEWKQWYLVGATNKVEALSVGMSAIIRCLPNTTYYAFHSKGSRLALGSFPDYPQIGDTSSNNVVVSAVSGGNVTYTTGVNDRYLMIWFYNSNADTGLSAQEVADTLVVNLHWDGERDGEYEAYEEHIYPLDSDLELRGIPKLDSNNKLYYDGDTYESDGTVTRKYGIVDLGTLDWNTTTVSENACFYAELPSGSQTPFPTMSGLCSVYANSNDSNMTNDKTCRFHGSEQYNFSRILIRDDSKSSLTTAQFKTSMSGIYAVYELTTPTTETADTFQNPQLVDNWGTEEYTDSRTIQIPVGHITKYPPDLKAKLESAPDSPASDGDYILRHNNGVNTYVADTKELPAVPTTDGTYVLKATVSSGTATLSWVAE